MIRIALAALIGYVLGRSTTGEQHVTSHTIAAEEPALEDLTYRELRKLAKDAGICGFHRMKRHQLETALKELEDTIE